MNETIDLLLKRRSVRAFRRDPVPEDVRIGVLEAMRRAPTAGNQTLYSVIEVESVETKTRLAELCDQQPFVATAPWVLVFLADLQRFSDFLLASDVEALRGAPIDRDLPDLLVHPQEGDLLLAACDAMIAAHTASVAAESLGLGACYIGDILENSEEVAALLDLPRYATPMTLVVLGYPRITGEDKPQTGRMALDDFVFTDTYRRLPPEHLSGLYEYNDRSGRRYLPGAKNFGQHEFLRKFSAPFMDEMRRSARAMLDRWR
ncbi:MAG: nitroreductase family protein [Spirochaeta sp.]|nr:nitroreductase family protein [Spirochaeta sp.]